MSADAAMPDLERWQEKSLLTMVSLMVSYFNGEVERDDRRDAEESQERAIFRSVSCL